MMSPYGAPYAAIYSPGGVYAHPAFPLVSFSFLYTFNNCYETFLLSISVKLLSEGGS